MSKSVLVSEYSDLNKTFLASGKNEIRNWLLIDGKNRCAGQLACSITKFLIGKKKFHYDPSGDIGDYVVIINADEIIMREGQKTYTVYEPGRPGRSLKEESNKYITSSFRLKRMVKGILSNCGARKYMKRLYVYNNDKHPHDAQNLIALNPKT